MKTKRLKLNAACMVMGVAFVLGITFATQAATIAYWRMESQMTTTSTCFSGTKGVADSATATGEGTLQGSCSEVAAADDPLITFNGNGDTVSISSTVPPTTMFNSGFSGGSGSYNAEAIADVDGALFFAQDRYGDEFTSASWTVEMFIKADGDQSGGGLMQLLKNDEQAWTYGLDLNESSAGGLRLFVQNNEGFPTVDLTDRNYADGNWYYIVCSYDQPTKKLTLRVRGQDGVVSENYRILSSDPLNTASGNLFLGRNTYDNTDRRTFRGLMDEVRISDAVLADSELIGKIRPDGTNVVAQWRFEEILNWGSATNWARFEDYATGVNQGTGIGGGGATPSQDYLNIYPGDTGVVITNVVPPASMFHPGFSGGANSYACKDSTAVAAFDPSRFGDELNTPSWTIEMFYRSDGDQSAPPDPDSNRMQLLRNGDWFYGVVANEAGAGSLRVFAQQTDGQFKVADLTDRNYSDGTWQYVVCTYNQPTKQLTLRVRSENGRVSSASTTLTADPKNAAQPLFLGAVDSGGARRVRGWMDEVRFSDNVQPDTALMGLINADSTNVLSSSANPAQLNSSITFTSTVATVVAGNGTPTGSVQFKTNGVAMGAPVTLVNGVATISTSDMSAGSYLVTAEYAGDDTFYGSTGSLTQVVNTPPVAGNAAFERNAGIFGLRILISDLLTNVTDADGDTISLVGTSTSTNGVNVTTADSYYLYYYNTNNVDDQFAYTVTDGFGGTNTGYVNIAINTAVTGQMTGQITSFSGGQANLTFHGIPNYQYITERSTNMTDWVDISTNTAGSNGAINVTDTFDDLGGTPPSSAYYRLKYQP